MKQRGKKKKELKEMRTTRSETDMCTPMFITALFIIARTWKQPKCSLTDERIKKMNYYSAIRKE